MTIIVYVLPQNLQSMRNLCVETESACLSHVLIIIASLNCQSIWRLFYCLDLPDPALQLLLKEHLELKELQT